MPQFSTEPSNTIEQGGLVDLITTPDDANDDISDIEWKAKAGTILRLDDTLARWDTDGLSIGSHEVRAVRPNGAGGEIELSKQRITITARPLSADDALDLNVASPDGPMAVTLQRSDFIDTPDEALWTIIRRSVDALSYRSYQEFIDPILCGTASGTTQKTFQSLEQRRSLPFPDLDPYRVLKAATEVFMMARCGVMTAQQDLQRFVDSSPEERDRLGLAHGDNLDALWASYQQRVNGSLTIPYLDLVRQKLGEVRIVDRNNAGLKCYGILREKLTSPCFIELIWSYWHEEGMLVQTMNAISLRFQNRRGAAQGPDPLGTLELDPLRPLNNLFWGYIQDEQHRLTVPRRAYEYDHHYGLTLFGKAVPPLRPADSRSKFLEAFHNLLHRCSIFYKEDDDTTMIADPFPVLNALREVHLLLAEGAHNQFGDLPWTARQEMLMQQWLLARPEFREFLPTRAMVVYPEPWMDRVDAMKKMQAWTDSSVRHFRDLAVTGEPILLSIRFGNWSDVINRNAAANWARYWRQEVQWYIQAYQSVTGVDLSADTADVRAAAPVAARDAQPALHLSRRLAAQRSSTRTKVGV